MSSRSSASAKSLGLRIATRCSQQHMMHSAAPSRANQPSGGSVRAVTVHTYCSNSDTAGSSRGCRREIGARSEAQAPKRAAPAARQPGPHTTDAAGSSPLSSTCPACRCSICSDSTAAARSARPSTFSPSRRCYQRTPSANEPSSRRPILDWPSHNRPAAAG